MVKLRCGYRQPRPRRVANRRLADELAELRREGRARIGDGGGQLADRPSSRRLVVDQLHRASDLRVAEGCGPAGVEVRESQAERLCE
jgi:hypothetical protein